MISSLLKTAMERRGISYAELARRVGLSERVLWNRMNGVSKISATELVLLSEELDLDLDTLRDECFAELKQLAHTGSRISKGAEKDA